MRLTVGLVLALSTLATPLHAQATRPPARLPDGATLVRLLGPRARGVFAPAASPGMGALVRLPAGVRGSDWGLREVAPGIGRLWGSPQTIVAFGDAHLDAAIELSTPLHPLLNTASGFVGATAAIQQGLDGSGALVGIADTGLDVTHPDFIDAEGHTRVAWLLDLSVPPLGIHPDLEQMFGSTDPSGTLVAGAVWSAQDIDAAMTPGMTCAAAGVQGSSCALPQDPVGHGTLVTSCAAGNGLGGKSPYRGIAPGATILFARVSDAGGGAIGNDELLRGVAFLFNRADALNQSVVVNLSIGTDFGPHDGTTAWEETLASYVGPEHPGRALVVAAGNSGSIADAPVHQNVHVNKGTKMLVPIETNGAAQSGAVEVWVAMHPGANLSVGLDAPGGTWVSPTAPSRSAEKMTGEYSAVVYNGSQAAGSPVPAQSQGAVVIWQGAWPTGEYTITLSGSGTADLYVDATGDASIPGVTQVNFANGVRESTVSLPSTNPSIIGVGCTINKPSWVDLDGHPLGLSVPLLDAVGGEPDPNGLTRDAFPGEPCWFSGAGPTLTGVFKPDIMAPGAAIVGALSRQATPPAPESIFTGPPCGPNMKDVTCQQIDSLHAVSFGTSFSSPIVAGAVAVMLQHDPTLTQDVVMAALQGGAHPLRGPTPFEDQEGPGEVDVIGAVEAVDRLRDPQLALPVRGASWMTLGGDQYLADGSTPLQGIVELRAAGTGGASPPPADGFAATRLASYALVNGSPMPGVTSLVRRGPGIWVVTLTLPGGLGGSLLTVGTTFDGTDIVDPKSIPIATDAWSAEYPPSIGGGCAIGRGGMGEGSSGVAIARTLAGLLLFSGLSFQRRLRRRAHTGARRGP
ncbi:MAG: S8 family serine peptidase [Polyangiaceae bacterium]